MCVGKPLGDKNLAAKNFTIAEVADTMCTG